MPQKLAITIAGAVSLGSYEAGVLYEVLDAIDQHNQAAADADKIIIDVLTGASAGGMTAIILAQKLLFSAQEFVGPYDNPLYNTWVRRISLAGLQSTQADEPALYSLFSSDLIETIARETLLSRYALNPIPKSQPHSSVRGSIRVGVALTNLNGVAYGYPVKPMGKFSYIDYGDQLTRLVDDTCDQASFWEPLRQAAVASGAFPIAFRTKDLQRSVKIETNDYGSENLEPWPNDPAIFTYSDGGILQNQPLGMAKNLVDMIDAHLDQENRFYLFVSPHAKDPDTNDSFHEANADYVHLIKRLLEVVMGQAGFQDWITARDLNRRVEILDKRAEGLKEAILGGEINVEALSVTAASLLKLLFPGGVHQPPGAKQPETLDAARARIADQYRSEMDELSDPPVRAAFRDAVLAFESAAGLGARDFMTIYGITATEKELAGARLRAFLGFFDQKFRDHDYDVGRMHARNLLMDGVAQAGGLVPIAYEGKEIRPIDSRLNGLKLSAVPAADLEVFKAGMRKRVEQMAREILGPYVSLPADPFIALTVNQILNHLISKF